ncbi:MAG: alkaline phosphatase [Gammaproteobacteria bacterium]|nr:alkaline phosphatase [Gammaproteobacteria bacterium]
MKRLIPFLFFLSCFPVHALEAPQIPKNIILFIGDGMGIAQITAGKIVKGRLNLEEFKHIGLVMTFSQNDMVTDSAAAGTAMATGYKTDNYTISMSSDGKPLKTVIEYAKDVNKATGLVASSSITHATPAVFAAHVDSRKKHTIIAEQIATSGIEVIFGGGWQYFVPNTTAGSKRADHKNLLADLAHSTQVIRTEEEFNNLGDVDSVVGLFSRGHLSKANKRKPGLPELTRKAIKILSKNDNGFFLMVEGSQIDWAGHDNNQDELIAEMIDFDDTIGVALDFAKIDSQTLILVTADHETGGFAIHDGSINAKKVTESEFTGSKHTAEMVPVFAYGPGASEFSGIGDNTKIGKTIIKYMKQAL